MSPDIVFPIFKYQQGGGETIAAKRANELMVDSHEVMIKSYHTDNSIYAEKAFTDEVQFQIVKNSKEIIFVPNWYRVCMLSVYHLHVKTKKN